MLKYCPPDGLLDILFQDHALLFVNKPAGVLSVPGRGAHLADCLLSRVRAAFPQALLVHRLDMDTSGVMVFAMSPQAQHHLGHQFEARKVKKAYAARVWGEVTEPKGQINLPLIVDRPNRPLQKVDWDTGKPARTEWYRMRIEDATTRVRLMPRTGRSHQLRVHMREIGHPILGDTLYANGSAHSYDRLMLHAEALRVNHPDGGRDITVKARVPF
ncbi:MAG: RluA family pseudouridine synthase [Rhodobacteraceae bacterium]|nr:RluA family pseudouridine synthase [Paracoccaceae bacterium]